MHNLGREIWKLLKKNLTTYFLIILSIYLYLKFEIYYHMEVNYLVIDSIRSDFQSYFGMYEHDFFYVLSKAYENYYGDEYHKKRIIESQAILYIALNNHKVIGVSYVKRNLRRGGIAIYPSEYRRNGIAENLIKLSLIDFPRQYSIISVNLEHSHIMLSLACKLGFKYAKSIEEIKQIVNNEFHLLFNFRKIKNYIVFDRKSERRTDKIRNSLTLVHSF